MHNQIKRVSKLNIEEAFKTIDSTAYMRLPVIGKQGLRGATLERVIDDQNPDELESLYGIGVKNYQNESEISGRIN